MLKNAMLNQQNYTFTENGALSKATSKSHILDLFALGASANGLNLENLILNALSEDVKLALKVIFYISDIREGQGRRNFFKIALKALADNKPEVTEKLLPYIAEFGRWDYLYWFVDTDLQNKALTILTQEASNAIVENRKSLVFKWMASEDASNKNKVRNAIITRKFMGLTPREYRQMLSKGRKELGEAVVERKMSERQWDDIDFSKVPSLAMTKYRNAFIKQNENGFKSYLTKVENGEAKINSSVLYPADIVHAGNRKLTATERRALVAQWVALPDFVGEGLNILPMLDTSGSMGCDIADGKYTAEDVGRSLAIYLAEKIEGEFHNTVLSFSSEARLLELPNGDVFDKVKYLERNSIVESTNLQSAFDLVLKTAIKNRVPQEQMPNRVLIISDMEFDSAVAGSRQAFTNLEVIRLKYEHAGYVMPQIIFWNVNARSHQLPATKDERGIVMASGFSPALMKRLVSADPMLTPFEAMLAVVDVPRYAFVDELV